MNIKTLSALLVLLTISSLALKATASDVFVTITSAGTYEVQLSETASTILRVNLPNMEASDAVGLRLLNLPDEAPEFEIGGSYCIPQGYAQTKNHDTGDSDYYASNWCGAGNCNGTEMEYAACPARRKDGCDYFMTISLRSTMKLKFEIRMAGYTFMDGGSLPIGTSKSLVNYVIAGKKAINFLVQPTSQIKQWHLHYTATSSVILRFNSMKTSPFCWGPGGQFQYGTSGTFEYEESSDCDQEAWIRSPQIYVSILLDTEITTDASSLFLNLNSFISYDSMLPKASILMGEQFSGVSLPGETAFYDINVGTVSYPGKVVLNILTLPDSDVNAYMQFSVMRDRVRDYCRVYNTEGSLGRNTLTTKYLFADGWSNPPPSLIRFRTTNSLTVPMKFNITVTATSAANGVTVDLGSEFKITQAPWSTADFYSLANTESISGGYLELAVKNYATSAVYMSIRASRAGIYSPSFYCYPVASNTTYCHIPLCFIGSDPSPIAFHPSPSYSTNLGYTVNMKQYPTLVPGEIIPATRSPWSGFVRPAGVIGPMRIRVTALPKVPLFDMSVFPQHTGTCAISDPGNTCYLRADRTSCEITLTCETDVLIFHTRDGPVVDMITEVIPMNIPILDATTPGASHTMTEGLTVGNDSFVMLQFPDGTTQATLHFQAPSCQDCPYCGTCIGWSTLNGCSFKGISCQANDCYTVLDITSTTVLLKARVYSAATTASVTVISSTGCQTPSNELSPFCAASVTYPVWPGTQFQFRPYLDVGASKIMTDLETVYPNAVNPYEYCYYAIKHLACVDSYPICKVPQYGPFVSTCKEFCQDALNYCPTDVRSKLSFLCDDAPACADVDQQPPSFVPPPPIAPRPPASAPVQAPIFTAPPQSSPEAAPQVSPQASSPQASEQAPPQAQTKVPTGEAVSSPSTSSDNTGGSGAAGLTAISSIVLVLLAAVHSLLLLL